MGGTNLGARGEPVALEILNLILAFDQSHVVPRTIRLLSLFMHGVEYDGCLMLSE